MRFVVAENFAAGVLQGGGLPFVRGDLQLKSATPDLDAKTGRDSLYQQDPGRDKAQAQGGLRDVRKRQAQDARLEVEPDLEAFLRKRQPCHVQVDSAGLPRPAEAGGIVNRLDASVERIALAGEKPPSVRKCGLASETDAIERRLVHKGNVGVLGGERKALFDEVLRPERGKVHGDKAGTQVCRRIELETVLLAPELVGE